MTISDRIREACEQKGIRQSDLARALGIPREKVWQTFQHRRRFTVEEFIKACVLLGLSLEDFEV